MTTIRLVLDTDLITADETRQPGQYLRQVLNGDGKNPGFLAAWRKPVVRVEVSTVPGATGTWHFYLTEKNRQPGALGWHGQENGSPAGWISPAAHGISKNYPAAKAFELFGGYTPALDKIVVDGKELFAGAPATLYKGLANTLAEEVMEALIDPAPLNPGVFATDSTGTEILVEVCDHASPGHFVIDVATRLKRFSKPVHQLMVGPDCTLPSFYDVKGAAPYTFVRLLLKQKSKLVVTGIAAATKAPFDFVTGSYAYRRKDGSGAMSYFAREDGVDVPLTRFPDSSD